MKPESHNLVQRGHTPLLISIPHAGTYIPKQVQDRLSLSGKSLSDTDWFIDRLYRWALQAGAGMIVATHSRLVVDLNRPPDDRPLYSGAGTGLVPLTTFSGEAIYLAGKSPEKLENQQRIEAFWQPYHDALSAEIQSILQRHGHVVLLDAHSISGEVPRLFSGVLPDLNLGSNEGRSASPDLIGKALSVLQSSRYSSVPDGRFKGGYITRNYGQPEQNIHALQLEISQRTYMQESPPEYRKDLAGELQSVLQNLIDILISWKADEI